MIYDERLSTGPGQEIYKKLAQVKSVFTLLAAIEISYAEIRTDDQPITIVKSDELFSMTVRAAFDRRLITYKDFEKDENALHTSRSSIDNWRRIPPGKGRKPEPLRAPPNLLYRERVIEFIFHACIARTNRFTELTAKRAARRAATS